MLDWPHMVKWPNLWFHNSADFGINLNISKRYILWLELYLEKTERPQKCYWFNVLCVLYELYFELLLTRMIIHRTFLFLKIISTANGTVIWSYPKIFLVSNKLVLKLMLFEKCFRWGNCKSKKITVYNC